MPSGRRPSDLPPGLPGLIRVRDAIQAGVSPTRLRATDLDASVWGLRSRRTLTNLRDRAAALLLRMPEGAFVSHASALALHGAPIPASWDHRRIDIAMPAPARGPHAAGVRGHRLARCEADRRHGFLVSVPRSAWVEAAMQLGVGDLVAAADAMLHEPGAILRMDELVQRAEQQPPHLAGIRIRSALGMVDAHAESAPESLLRVLILQAGLPRPEVNVSIRLGGRHVRPDLSWAAHRVIVEYQGDYHRDVGQWRADMRRREALESDGWRVIESNWQDILQPRPLLSRLRRHLLPPGRW